MYGLFMSVNGLFMTVKRQNIFETGSLTLFAAGCIKVLKIGKWAYTNMFFAD
jgi:hypothetical protein